jgi:hypothetical protein
MMHQRSAEEDDFRAQAMGLYDSLVQEHIQAKMTPAAKEDLANVLKASEPVEVAEELSEEPMIVAPEPLGPVLEPLTSTGVPWW